MEDETDEVVEDVEEEEVVEKKPKKKAKAPAKSKAKSSRAAKPAARMRIVWVVLNDAFKPVGTFDYTQKEAADARAAELTAKGKGTHFVQRTKEAMPEDAPGIGAAIPRVVAPTRKLPAQRPQQLSKPRSKTRKRSRKKRMKSKSRKPTTTMNDRGFAYAGGIVNRFGLSIADAAVICIEKSTKESKWAHGDSNTGPHPYQGCALAN